MLKSLRKQLLRAMVFLLRAFHVSSSMRKPEAASQPTASEVSAASTGYPELEERFSTAAGLYVTDLALIRLSRDESYWAEGNEPTLRRLAVFVHEYAHYLHNFSTVTGVYGFVTSMRRLRLFAHTVPKEGRSEGSQVLEPDELLEYQGTQQLRGHMAGDLKIDAGIKREAKRGFEVLGWDFETREVSLVSQELELKRVKVRLRAGSLDASLESEFWLGAHVLSESLAWEMERGVRIQWKSTPWPCPHRKRRLAA